MKAEKMKAKLLIVGGIITAGVIIAACKKDAYNTKPIITFKDISPTTLQTNERMTIKLEITDKEGDISGDTLWIETISKNCPSGNFTKGYQLAEFPTQSDLKTEVDLNYVYGTQLPGVGGLSNSCPQPNPTSPDPPVNDTCHMRFWIRDNANNASDTVVSSNFVLIGRK
jgi:hypothetical protein